MIWFCCKIFRCIQMTIVMFFAFEEHWSALSSEFFSREPKEIVLNLEGIHIVCPNQLPFCVVVC